VRAILQSEDKQGDSGNEPSTRRSEGAPCIRGLRFRVSLLDRLAAGTSHGEMPDYQDVYPDMVEPAYILFDESGGEFALGYVTGAIHGIASSNACDFTWSGSDEMDEVCGDGWAALTDNGTLEGEISFQNGEEASFTARRWDNSSTAC
jgi:hypothetical protein